MLGGDELHAFLDQAIERADSEGGLCGLLLVHLRDNQGQDAARGELKRAAQIVARLMRQHDAVGVMEDGTLAVVLHALDYRGDAHVTLERLEAFACTAGLPWQLSTGVSVYPFSGEDIGDLWAACEHDLEGAMSSPNWEHIIPRETLLTHVPRPSLEG